MSTAGSGSSFSVPSNRVANLRAALDFLQLAPRAPELRLLHQWLDTWAGIGLVIVGMARQGFSVDLGARGGQVDRGLLLGARRPPASHGSRDRAGGDGVACGAAGGVGGGEVKADARVYWGG